jgi:hypothetical protein
MRLTLCFSALALMVGKAIPRTSAVNAKKLVAITVFLIFVVSYFLQMSGFEGGAQ